MSGLPPAIGPDPVVLILGSFPGEISLRAGEYYAHPANAFWRVMEALFGVSHALPYPERLHALTERGVALWDVLSGCTRKGSSDASIRDAVANDIPALLGEHPTIRVVALNGRAAEQWLRRTHPETWDLPGVTVVSLPSTSPAHARLGLDRKIACWRSALPHPPQP
ncbi:DNA-deoxyinosine glycosylase [Methanofollis fontis]|uniref:DNA-deoxyinosine glycosylase n=1 Tax=Methanofollis fontis TaxID=2052832 RepID=A0A483CT50_9EURY|nr:DNA-deoxyinosine glycosylase [Methanofollis fontis]TAJ43844.1 DNA-deoxyinosine glycosylase [Methanofollis fontis]